MVLHSHGVSAWVSQPASLLKDILSIYVLEEGSLKTGLDCKVGFLLDVLSALHSAKSP